MIIFRGRRRYVFLGALVSALALISDQAAKFAVLSWFREMSEIIEVTGFLNLVLVWNRGVSFGMFSGDSRWNTVFLIILALGIVAFLLTWLFRTERRVLAVALGLVIGGAFGNVIDRFFHGAVVDFLDFHVGNWHWPAFNIADGAITVGAVVLIADALFRGGEKHKIMERDNVDGVG